MTLQDLLQKMKGKPLETILGFLVVLLAVFSYVRGNTQERLQEEVETLRRQGTQANENIRRAANLEEDLQELVRFSESLNERLFQLPLENVVAMQNALERNKENIQRLARTTGVELTEVQFRPAEAPAAAPARGSRASRTATEEEAPAPGFVSHSFRLAVQGDFKDLVAFVYALESGRHYLRPNSFYLQRSPVEGDRRVIATFTISFLGAS